MEKITRARTGIHLPSVDPRDKDEVLDRIVTAGDSLPEITLQMSSSQAHRAAAELEQGAGPLTHWDVLRLIIGVVETLFDDEVKDFSPAFHAQLLIMLQFPSVPEAVSTQIAFGRKVGEMSLKKIERLSAAADKRGLSVDEHVADLAARDEIEHDLPVRCFLGESRRNPDQARMRRVIDLFRVTAALAIEPLRPPVLCVISWTLWALGKRSVALAYLREASEIDPTYPLAAGLATHIRQRQPQWIQA